MGNNKEKIDPIEQKALKDAMNNFYASKAGNDIHQTINKAIIPECQPVIAPHPVTHVPQPQVVNMSGFQSDSAFQANPNPVPPPLNLDPNLTVGYEIVKFPSKGLYYPSKISEVVVEYMTSKDEDILSTSSLIENGTVLDVLLKNKIKTLGINTDELLVGDRNAVLLFLRASSYGQEYGVSVSDPRTGNAFQSSVDLTQLKAKEIKYTPDERGEFSYLLPIRKVLVKFKILNYSEINNVLKSSEAIQEAYGEEYSQFGSLKLKSEIVEVAGQRHKEYITSFVDAMPAKDSSELKKRISEVTPDVDMTYEFTAPSVSPSDKPFKFKAKISVGVDFFFPFI